MGYLMITIFYYDILSAHQTNTPIFRKSCKLYIVMYSELICKKVIDETAEIFFQKTIRTILSIKKTLLSKNSSNSSRQPYTLYSRNRRFSHFLASLVSMSFVLYIGTHPMTTTKTQVQFYTYTHRLRTHFPSIIIFLGLLPLRRRVSLAVR